MKHLTEPFKMLYTEMFILQVYIYILKCLSDQEERTAVVRATAAIVMTVVGA